MPNSEKHGDSLGMEQKISRRHFLNSRLLTTLYARRHGANKDTPQFVAGTIAGSISSQN